MGLALAVAGCVPVHGLDAPPDEGARSVLLLFDEAGAPVVFAADVETTIDAALPPFAGSPSDRDLHVVEFGCPLSELGLAPGVQTLDPVRTNGLPAPLAAFAHDAARGAWQPLDGLPTALATTLRSVAPRDRVDCPTTAFVDVAADLEWSLGLADGAVLAAARGGVYYRVREAGPERLAALSGNYLAAHRRGDELWVAGSFGHLARGDLATGFVGVHGQSIEKVGALWLTGAPAAAPFELFRVEPRGRFDRLTGTSTVWAPASEPLPRRRPLLETGGVVWRAPGDAIAIGDARLVHHRPDAEPLVLELLGPDLTAIEVVPGVGTVVGDARGQLFTYDGASLTLLASLPSGAPILGITPLGRGFVAVTEARVDFWDGALRACLDEPLLAKGRVPGLPDASTAAILGDGRVTFLHAPDPGALDACSRPARD
ncbi:hypothetical protein L6R52_41530 [Myxococcota bacterium]|nr:hypothetical protein [Myxococcota bacterium]